MSAKRTGLLCFLFGGLVLLISYLMLAFEYKTFFLGPVPVHEDGVRTFWQTVFYTGHFLREWPLCLLMALSFTGAWKFPYLNAPVIPAAFSRKIFWLGLAGAAFVFLAALLKTISHDGFRSALFDLGQFRTRGGELVYGSHWRYHFLHAIFIQTAAMSLFCAVRGVLRYPAPGHGVPLLRKTLPSWLCLFLILNLIFPPNALIFTDTRYLAHQLREIVTHFLLTLPFAAGTLFLIEEKTLCPLMGLSGPRFYFKQSLLWGLPALLVPAGIFSQLYGRDVAAAADKQVRFANLFAAHNFEHSLDYVFIIFLVMILAGKSFKNDRPA